MRHLIHIGYPKAGSKFLQNWFARHPQLAFRTSGIAGFDSVYALEREAAVPKKDLRVRVTSLEGLSAPRGNAGEDLVDYEADTLPLEARQRQACALLQSLFPDALILIVTRGFRSMILSSYSQYVRSGGDSAFEDLIAHALAARGEDDHPLVSTGHWNYDRLIAGYREAFGAGNVIVMPWELLRDDPAAFVAALEDRLGLDPWPASHERLNPTLSPVEMAWYPRLTPRARKLLPASLFRLYVGAAFRNRLGSLIGFLQRIRPLQPVSESLLPDEVVEGFRDCARSLAANPLYGPYAGDYLFNAEPDRGRPGRSG